LGLAVNVNGQSYFLATYNPQTGLLKPNFDGKGGIDNAIYLTMDDSSFFATHSPSINSDSVNNQKFTYKKDIITYTVEQGDTLSTIAEKFNISLNTLLWANKLTARSIIKPGDNLTILPVNGVLHKVKNGETVIGIALTYDAKEEDIIDFNNLDEDGFIITGQILIIPGGKQPSPPQYKAPKNGKSSSQYASIKGYFIIPASGRFTQGLHSYNAVDIGNSCGTPVYAAASGSVLVAKASGWNKGYGKYIQIQHPNGTSTLYAHLEQVNVSPGQEVGQREVIGLMGTTGRSSGCHLHFEVRGAPNPFAY
jgi:LysM repeat protein